MGIEKSVDTLEVVALESSPPLVLDIGTPVREVIRRMRERRLGCALITRAGKLAGIFTERDVLLKIVGAPGALAAPVADWMTAEPEAVTEHEPVRRAVTRMQRGGFRHLPVVDAERRVVGWVRHKDVVNYLVEHFAERVLNLPPDPGQVARAREGG